MPGYIDEGLSGISTRKREDFNRMIADVKEDKFDLVITKEISRFARNTLDSIGYTRELLKHGIGVYFQNDNINLLGVYPSDRPQYPDRDPPERPLRDDGHRVDTGDRRLP